MAITYETVTPTPVENAIVQKLLLDGVHKRYMVEAADGYVLHDSRGDRFAVDENGDYTDEVIPRFRVGSGSVNVDYDFNNIVAGTYTYTDENGMEVTIPVSMVGMYQFYALPESIVPMAQTWEHEGDHEVMSEDSDTETN